MKEGDMMGKETEDGRQKTEGGTVQADFESLKAVCQKMVARRNWFGLNPHKVLRLCMAFEQIRETELSETPVINGEQPSAPVAARVHGQDGHATMAGPLRDRVITTLTWLVADARHRFDDCKNNLDNGSGGGYSPELAEAIELLDELKEGTAAGIHGQDGRATEGTLKAAYEKGFEDCKKHILEEIQKLVK